MKLGHFDLREFVCPAIYSRLGEKSIWLIDQKIIDLANFTRDFFQKPVIINNWHSGGQYKESGLREMMTTTGAAFSQHKFGRAIDIKIPGLTAEFIRGEIMANEYKFIAKGLTTIEADTPTWVHLDTRNTGLKDILIVPYK